MFKLRSTTTHERLSPSFLSTRPRASLAMSADEPPRTCYFFCTKCPLDVECSTQAFKRANLWGWTEEACRERIKDHLATSGKHSTLLDGEPEHYAELADVESVEWDGAQQQQQQQQQHQQKKRRYGSGGNDDMADIVNQAVSAAIAKAAMPPPGGQPMSGAASSSDSVVALPMTAPASQSIMVPRDLLQATADALHRSHQAARHAQRLSENAASVFGNEATVFHEVRANLSALLNRQGV